MLLQWSCDLAVVVFGEYWLFYCGTRRHRLDGKYIEEVMSFVKLIIAVAYILSKRFVNII